MRMRMVSGTLVFAVLSCAAVLLWTGCTYNPYLVRYLPGQSPVIPAKVIQVYDGDTILVEALNLQRLTFNDGSMIQPGETNRVRFLFIDTMESHMNPRLIREIKKGQKTGDYQTKDDMITQGEMATEHLKSLLKEGSPVEIEFSADNPKDIYGRILGVVHYGTTNINYLQVWDGFAKAYVLGNEKAKSGSFYARRIAEAERFAKELKRGIWQQIEE